jgi:hypothetical protein
MRSESSAWFTPFTVPCVPTGMNMGVCISPLSVLITPARALLFLSVLVIENFKSV